MLTYAPCLPHKLFSFVRCRFEEKLAKICDFEQLTGQKSSKIARLLNRNINDKVNVCKINHVTKNDKDFYKPKI